MAAHRNKQRVGEVPRSWVLIAASVILALLTLNVHVELAREPEADARGTGPTPVAESRIGQLRLRGWADRSKVPSSGRVRVYLTLENRSDKPVDEISLSLEADGFDVPSSIQSSFNLGTKELPESSSSASLGSLEPSQAATVWFDLRASKDPRANIIAPMLTWRSGTTRITAPLSIGPVEVRPGRNWLLVLGRSVLAFFKDLALPIVLGLLAYAFQHLQQEKTGLQETFHVMLPRAHENIVRYLLAITASANRFLLRLSDAKGPPGPKKELALQQSLFYLLAVVKGMRDLAHQGGGIFLTSIPGEFAVYHCWNAIWARVESELGTRETSEILDGWGRNETFTSLQKKFKPPSGTLFLDPSRTAFARVETSFKNWIDRGFDYESKLLRAFSEIMQYEINKLYGLWYQSEPEYPRESVEELTQHPAISEKLRNALKSFEEFSNPEGSERAES